MTNHTAIPLERRATPSEPESLALIAIQQKGLIKAAEATRQEAREAKLAAHEAHDLAVSTHKMLLGMREWQEQHAAEAKPLFEALPELIQIAESLRWVLTGRAVMLWFVGGIIALGAVTAAIDAMWDSYLMHRGP